MYQRHTDANRHLDGRQGILCGAKPTVTKSLWVTPSSSHGLNQGDGTLEAFSSLVDSEVLPMGALRNDQASSVMSALKLTFVDVPPLDNGRSASAHAPLGLRLKVRITRGRLDRQIAAGRRCDASAELALRARQLTDPRSQQETARNLRRIIDYVDRRGSRPIITSVVIERRAVRYGRLAILELAEQLERAAPVNPRGIVLARAFITDGLSPVANPHSERTVTEVAAEAQEALNEHPIVGFDTFAV
jgi:hypothetical protein